MEQFLIIMCLIVSIHKVFQVNALTLSETKLKSRFYKTYAESLMIFSSKTLKKGLTFISLLDATLLTLFYIFSAIYVREQLFIVMSMVLIIYTIYNAYKSILYAYKPKQYEPNSKAEDSLDIFIHLIYVFSVLNYIYLK